ncbi:DUF2207 domain-containing protein [Metabacillus litoralis]|uniref:DUF2207 domain-containing protein n=1 Tax=Metabacillus litoralis TaxID=152268 RepID=UPI001CFE974F|nr:DUF2207 domain-containing protein [Metabacillus litoralis]
MRKKIISSLFFLLLLLFFPYKSYAVEYNINNVSINAYLQENGNVQVYETHTYEFEGEFNGITRQLIPKKSANISQFSANENNKSLKVNKEGSVYKIYRKGADEKITITLQYMIENGVEIYQDAAQFYWPFFDDRNESSYENLIITIHPPAQTDTEVIALGYDEAFQTESIQQDDSVIFHFGYVPSESNGDIRVAYDPKLFSNAPIVSEIKIKQEILNEKQALLDQAKAKEETKITLNTISIIGLPIFATVLFLLMFNGWFKARSTSIEIKRESITFSNIPKLRMSLIATIYYTNQKHLPPQAMAAALLDLVRKGYVKQTSNSYFQLIHRKGALPHEQILIQWLFDKIGYNQQFSFEDLRSYTKNEKNHTKYISFQTKWKQAVKDEISEQSFYQNKTVFRLLVGFSSLLLLPFLFFFPIYDSIGSFFTALLLFIVTITFAIAYHPKTLEGVKLSYEWENFKEKYKTTNLSEWEKWPEEDQVIAYIYGLGINDKKIRKKNEDLVMAFKSHKSNSKDHHHHDSSAIFFLGPHASSSFYSADQSAGSTTHNSSSTSSGGGTGGGGGGSGAF